MVIEDFNKRRMEKIIEGIADAAEVPYDTVAALISTSYLKGYRDGIRGENALLRKALIQIFDEIT